MSRAPDWTEDEFRLLLENPRLSSGELAALLSRRTAEAIETVRQGIAAYRAGKNASMLSQMMLRVLDEPEPA